MWESSIEPRERAIDLGRRGALGFQAFRSGRIARNLVVVRVESLREAEAAIENVGADERRGPVTRGLQQPRHGRVTLVQPIDTILAHLRFLPENGDAQTQEKETRPQGRPRGARGSMGQRRETRAHQKAPQARVAETRQADLGRNKKGTHAPARRWFRVGLVGSARLCQREQPTPFPLQAIIFVLGPEKIEDLIASVKALTFGHYYIEQFIKAML